MINAINIIPKKTAGCPVMGDYAIAKKMNVTWANRKKGDIVLFDFNHNGTSDHIGIVVSVNSDGSITTIEGNTGSGNNTNGGEVQKRTRYKSQVNYFIRPKYSKEVTADMVIATAKSQLGVKESPKGSNKVKYNVWFFGKNIGEPWCCTFVCWVFAHVGIEKEEKPKEEIKPITKPTTKYSGDLPTPTLKNGSKGEGTKKWQKFLNWYGKFGLTVDGEFGAKTLKATKVFQKIEGLTTDGIVGKNTLAAAKKYQIKNPSNEVSIPKTPKADKIVAKITALAWAYGTASKKYAYSTGKPKDAMKTAMQKHGYKTKVAYSDCGYCVNTIVMEALGGKFKALGKVKEKFPTNSGWAVVHKGKAVPSGLLKAGDVIRYKKTNGAQHTLFYYGNGKIAEGGRKTRFFVIKKDEGKYNKSNVKKATIEVLRVKE